MQESSLYLGLKTKQRELGIYPSLFEGDMIRFRVTFGHSVERFIQLVYGMKGVASQIPPGCYMVQCRGGTDDVEQEFSRNRQLNSNPTLGDMRGQIARGTGVRASDFARYTKNNTSGNKQVFYKELLCTKMKNK